MQYLRALSQPGFEPQIASNKGPASDPRQVIALIFPEKDKAQIVIVREQVDGKKKVLAESKRFGFYPQGNWTASLEDFSSSAPDRFSVSFSFRVPCARASHTYRFALRNSHWMVVGLDEMMLSCPSDKESMVREDTTHNFLTKKYEYSLYDESDNVQKRRRGRSKLRLLPLEAFPPNMPEYEELQ